MKTLILIVATFWSIFWWVNQTHALSCIFQSMNEMFWLHDDIFIAKVIDGKPLNAPVMSWETILYNYQFNIQVIERFKGNKVDWWHNTFIQWRKNNEWWFNSPLGSGKSYIIFWDHLSIGGCSMNQEIWNFQTWYINTLRLLSKRSDISKFDRYTEVQHKVYNFMRNYNYSHETMEIVRKKRKQLQKKRLDQNTSCEELVADECYARYNSCKFSHEEWLCKNITQEYLKTIKQTIELCEDSDGIYESNQFSHWCTCPSIDVPKTIQELQHGMEQWKFGNQRQKLRHPSEWCIYESEMCIIKGKKRPVASYVDVIEKEILTLKDCIQDDYQRYRKNRQEYVKNNDYPLYYNGSRLYRDYNTNTCYRRKYDKMLPLCSN
jgi:hypothetical protein